MTVVNQSWLYKNDTRKYPLADEATGATHGLVDISVSIPDALAPPSSRAYISGLIVSPNVAIVNVSLEGYAGVDGSELIATLTVESPEAYRLQVLTAVAPGVRGFAIFGSACQAGRSSVSETHTAATGTLVAAVVTRYEAPADTRFTVDGIGASDVVTMLGISGIVAEIVPVYFQDTAGTRRALVFRLERTNDAMLAPVAPCDMPAEVANNSDLVTSINGVFPDSSGAIVFQFRSAYDFEYNPDGTIKLGENELPLFSTSKFLANLTYVDGQATNELCFLDNFDYHVLCSEKKRLTAVTPAPVLGSVSNCVTQSGNAGGGVDINDGMPIALAGAAIWQDKLVLYWSFSAQGTPAVGADPLNIVIGLPEKPPKVTDLVVVGVVHVRGSPPKFPSDLQFGTLTPITPGTLGSPVYTVYQLNRPSTLNEAFTIKLPKSSVVKNLPPAFPVGYPTYHSAAKDDKCVRYARSPTSQPSEEFQ